MKLNDLKNKKVLILGFGREGKDNFLFLRKLFPQKVIGIADAKFLAKPGLTKGYFGKNYLKSLKDYDVIVKSPGVPFKILPKSALKKIITQTDIFFDNCPGEIVGITGTKGKSTTASMIYKVLKAGGIKSHLIGNIGKPVLSFLGPLFQKRCPTSKKYNVSLARDLITRSSRRFINDVFVYELSSHQLYNLKKSPQIAVFLNVYPEHLDYYKSFKEYARAKANITLHQTKNDYLIYNSQDKLVSKFARKSKAKKIPIKGEYYELNKNAAKAVGRIFKVPVRVIERAIKQFKYLPHRLELVGKFKGITFYNDALATIPEATIMAMENLGNRVETLMLGGFERNINFKALARKILRSKIKTVILFPTTGEKIWKEILKTSRNRGEPRHFFVDRAMRTSSSSSPSPRYSAAQYMKTAVKLAYLHTKKGKICLLSTASSSFSIFRDYKEKGNLFKKQVFAQAKMKMKMK